MDRRTTRIVGATHEVRRTVPFDCEGFSDAQVRGVMAYIRRRGWLIVGILPVKGTDLVIFNLLASLPLVEWAPKPPDAIDVEWSEVQADFALARNVS